MYGSPPPPLLCARHHPTLVMAISCKVQILPCSHAPCSTCPSHFHFTRPAPNSNVSSPCSSCVAPTWYRFAPFQVFSVCVVVCWCLSVSCVCMIKDQPVTHTHTQRTTPPTPTHTHTHTHTHTRQEQHPNPPNEHLPHTFNIARRWRDDGVYIWWTW